MKDLKCFSCDETIDLKDEYCNFYMKEIDKKTGASETFTSSLCKDCSEGIANDATRDLSLCEQCGEEIVSDEYLRYEMTYNFFNSERKNRTVKLNLCRQCSEESRNGNR